MGTICEPPLAELYEDDEPLVITTNDGRHHPGCLSMSGCAIDPYRLLRSGHGLLPPIHQGGHRASRIPDELFIVDRSSKMADYLVDYVDAIYEHEDLLNMAVIHEAIGFSQTVQILFDPTESRPETAIKGFLSLSLNGPEIDNRHGKHTLAQTVVLHYLHITPPCRSAGFGSMLSACAGAQYGRMLHSYLLKHDDERQRYDQVAITIHCKTSAPESLQYAEATQRGVVSQLSKAGITERLMLRNGYSRLTNTASHVPDIETRITNLR